MADHRPHEWLPYATRALQAAIDRRRDDAVADVAELIRRYGPEVLADAACCWCDMVAQLVPATPEQYEAGLTFAPDSDLDAVYTADQVLPALAWGGQFYMARARRDHDMCWDMIQSVPTVEAWLERAWHLLMACGLTLSHHHPGVVLLGIDVAYAPDSSAGLDG